MKKNYLILLFVLLVTGAYANNGRRDTVTDSWSVSYNGKEILAYKINSVTTYLIDSIADNSTILIDYYTAEPCAPCLSRLQFRDDNGKVMATVEKKGFGVGEPFRLPGRQFRQLMKNHKLFLYFSANPDGWGTWILLGVVQTAR